MTRLYLAYSVSGEAKHTLPTVNWTESGLGLLVSYYYLPHYRLYSRYWKQQPQQTMLDSGAFSAWKSGATIDINALIGETKRPHWKESVALDVIGDGAASYRNALLMKAAGSPAFPVFHISDDWALLPEYTARFDKVGLSCRFGEPMRDSYRFLDKCFAKAWPHRFHSFGWLTKEVLQRYPFHSADSASWNLGPAAFGNLPVGLQEERIPFRHGLKDIGSSVQYYARLGAQLKAQWAKEMARWN